MRLLVTGGAGFIGSHIVEGLLRAGHEAVVLDNLSSGRAAFVPAAARFVRGDLRHGALLAQVLRDERIDAIAHLAAQVSVRVSVEEPLEDASVNVLGSLTLLQAAVETGVRKFMFVSTGGAIYGERERLPTLEDDAAEPCSPYGVNKLVVEKYLHVYGYLHGIDWQVLRLANVYGPRQDPFGEASVVAIFSQAAVDGREAVINGDGEQTRDFIYVGDVCEAVLALLNHEAEGIFNVGSGRETSIVTLARQIGEVHGQPLEVRHAPAKQGEQRRSAISAQRLQQATGWQPRVELEQGLRHTLDFFRTHKEP